MAENYYHQVKDNPRPPVIHDEFIASYVISPPLLVFHLHLLSERLFQGQCLFS